VDISGFVKEALDFNDRSTLGKISESSERIDPPTIGVASDGHAVILTIGINSGQCFGIAKDGIDSGCRELGINRFSDVLEVISGIGIDHFIFYVLFFNRGHLRYPR
jgi:hypothetical protein